MAEYSDKRSEVAGADRERGRGPGGTKGGVQCSAAGAACAIVADGADGAATQTITTY
jgi:hypothetical protein